MQSPSIFINPSTGVFLSPSLLLSIICAATQVTWPEAAAQRNNLSLCSALISSLSPLWFRPFPISPGASFDPGAAFLYKNGGKSPSGSWERGGGCPVGHTQKPDAIILKQYLAPRCRSFCTAGKDGGDGKDLGHLAVLGWPDCHRAGSWLMAGEQILYHRCGSGNTLLQGPTRCEQEAPDFPPPTPPSPQVTAGLVQFDVPECSCTL